MAGETNDTSIAERERQAAEDRAFELNPHGTGVDPDLDLNYNYDYEASPELTDADYQPNNNFSDDFTNYAGADPYSSQFGQNNEADEDDETKPDADEDVDTIEDWDDEGDDDDDGEAEEQWRRERQDADQDSDEDYKLKTTKVKKEKDAYGRDVTVEYSKQKRPQVKWQEGDPINTVVLNNVWKKCKRIKSVVPMMQAANAAVDQMLLASGSTLVLKLARYVNTVKDANESADTIGTMLDIIASNMNKSLLYTTVAVVEAIGDQQWMQPLMILGMQEILDSFLAMAPLKQIMEKLFKVAVPFINGVAKDDAKKGPQDYSHKF